MKRSQFLILGNVCVVIFGWTSSAWAYLDPGTGSMILQLLLGGVAGAIVVLKLYWRRFVGLFRGNTLKDAGNSSAEDRK